MSIIVEEKALSTALVINSVTSPEVWEFLALSLDVERAFLLGGGLSGLLPPPFGHSLCPPYLAMNRDKRQNG